MVDFTDQEEVLAEVLPGQSARPKKITVVVVIAIILSILYLMGFLGAIPGFIIHMVAPGGFNFAPDTDDPEFRMQAEMQANMAEVTQTYFIPMVLLAFASLGVGSFMLYSSIQILRRDLIGDYRLLNTTMIFAILLVILNTIATILIQLANWRAMESAFMQADSGSQAAVLKQFMLFSMVIGIAIGVLFEIGKLIFYMFARSILGHHITTLKESSTH